jgi:hypothetical protein
MVWRVGGNDKLFGQTGIDAPIGGLGHLHAEIGSFASLRASPDH